MGVGRYMAYVAARHGIAVVGENPGENDASYGLEMMRATGRIAVAGSSRALGLRKVARSVRARRRGRLVLVLSRRETAAVRRALARHRSVKAAITVVASNRYGNSTRGRRIVRLRR